MRDWVLERVDDDRELRELVGLIPGYDPIKTRGETKFSAELAHHALGFFKDCCIHTKGDKAGDAIDLEPWQRSIVANLFGWVRPDGTRRYREAMVFVPRKNGKTTLLGGLVLYALLCDGEPGAEVYSAAATREQASLVFAHSAAIAERVEDVKARCEVHRSYKSISVPATNSSYKALASDVGNLHGLNAHFVVVDELHALGESELVDVLVTSTGARRQPLIVYITTSDYERSSICNRKHAFAQAVRDGDLEDPSFLPVLYEASLEDDWTDPEVWKRANPNLGVSVSLEYLKRECLRAKAEPAYENTFKRLHLNIRTEAARRHFNMERWRECAGEVRELELEGSTCYAGLDLASTHDLNALVLYFPYDGDAVLPYFWVPGETAISRRKKGRAPYDAWLNQGLIRMTESETTDHDRVRQDILEILSRFDVREIAFDPYNARETAIKLAQEGYTMVQFLQSIRDMNEPIRRLTELVTEKELRHGGNEVLTWMAGNAVTVSDTSGNSKWDKMHSGDMIDGIVALTMAIGRAIIDDTGGASIYDDPNTQVTL